MSLNYINASEADFSLGIDVRSSENQLAPGFVQDLLNADVIEKRIRKRAGYQGYAGNIPVRVSQLEYNDTDNQICFDLDESVDLGVQRSIPIVVYGRSSSIASGGPFTTAGDTVRYYEAFTVPTKKVMLATASAPPYESIPITSSEHGIPTTNMFVGVAESTSVVNRSYQTALPHEILLDVITNDIDIQYQNSTGADKEIFVYYKERQVTTGEVYIATLTHTGSGLETFTIPTATHGLANFNIVAQIQEDLTTDRALVKAETLTVEPDGDVVITLNSSAATTFYAILSTAPISQQVSGNIGAMSTGTVTISDVTSPWIFYSVYLETVSGGDRELVYPDTIDYDDSNSQVTLTFTNNLNVARNFQTFYLYGATRANQLCVTDTSVTVNATDTRPQLTIWGLDHTQIYGEDAGTRAGWVTHIDSYRSAGEQRLISGLGGNLFAARSYSEAGITYAYANLQPNAQARVSTATVLGPVFYDTSDTPERTGGYITSDDSGTNWALVTAVSYDTGNGWTKYTLSLPNKQILDSTGTPTTLGSVINTTSNLEDWLTLQDMGFARFNGTFRIRQILDGTDEIFVWVENDGVTGSDYDDANCGGSAAIMTDHITWSVTSPFLPGDVVSNPAFEDVYISSVLSSSGSVSVIDGATSVLSLAAGIVTTATRTSDVIPLRTAQPSAVPSVDNLVAGDMLYYTTPDEEWDGRLLRTLYVNTDTDRTVNITSDGTTATATLTSGSTIYLSVGGRVILSNAGVYSGVQTITDITGVDTLTFASEETASVTGGTLLGNTAQLDESFQWQDTTDDTTSLTVGNRWIPVEAPDDSYNQTPSTYISHLSSGDYDEQSFLRSTMVVNNTYLTNYADEVYKYDGTNIYRAGIFPWQPGLFITQDTAATAEIVTSLRNVSYTSAGLAQGRILLGNPEDAGVIPIGASVRLTGSSELYTVRAYAADPNIASYQFLYFDRALDSSVALSGTAGEVGVYRYYFRLNAVDANNNIIASAVTGYQDHVVELTEDAAINLKGVGLPAWGIYDYDRLEVEIYRTKQSTAAPFYRISTIQMDFDNTEGYFTYTDSFADSDLIDLDTVSTALKGTELGIAWQEPLRAKYITSLGNSLVLGNIKDYPQLDIQIVASGAVTDTTYAGKIFTFRKDNTDTGNTTSMPTRARYELRQTSSAIAVTAASGSAGVSFTATVANTAVAGDWVYLFWSTVATSGRPLTYSGWWQIASATPTDVTVNFVGAGGGVITTTVPDRALFATDPTDIPVPLGTDGNMGMANGDSFDLFDVGRRFSMAINATMRMVDTSITGMDVFSPWLTARGGNDVGKAGRIVVRQPRTTPTTLEVQLPSTFSGGGASFEIFVNEIRRTASTQVSASTRLYPSRIGISYENYPEIFDNPTAVLDTESDSVIDINSADGQEITGILPFFGEAAFGAAQQSAILVVFKTNSIYLVDINEKRAGRNAVQRIETEGLGCTAPYSIAVTKNGIIFANESGIYCLRRNQAIDYIGRYMERNWTERVDLDQLSIAQGHHYGVGRVYKLSVPLTGEEANSEAYVYNHTGETEGKQGSWARYDNHPATGWANLSANAFFASTLGRVFSIRNLGTETDFRDDSASIAMRLDTRALDFGNSGIRKVLDRAVINYRVSNRSEGTSVLFSVDLSEEFTESTPVIIPHSTSTDGIDDVPNQAIYQVAHNTNRRRGTYFQVRVENSTIDEGPEVAGMDFRVGGLQSAGIIEAQQTRSK